MIKTLRAISKQDKERFVVPKGVQDVIPVTAIYSDGIFRIGKDKFTKTFKFTDINYAVASREDKEEMFLEYSELLNSFDSGATTKITINNRRLNRLDFEKSILIPLKGDYLDEYRKEYNQMLLEKATGANSMVQDKYITVSVCKKNIEDARTYFSRVGNDMIAHLSKLGSRCIEIVVTIDISDTHNDDSQKLRAELKGALRSNQDKVYIKLNAEYDNNELLAIPILSWGGDLHHLQEMKQRGYLYDIDCPL